MAKCMKKGGSKKIGYFDLGGNFVDMSSQYQSMEPTSSYGSMGSEGDKQPPWKKAYNKRTRRAVRRKGRCASGQCF